MRHGQLVMASLVWVGFASIAHGGETIAISVDSNGVYGNSTSGVTTVGGLMDGVSMSADGWYVAFVSGATNLVANDTNGSWDIFVRDVVNGTTTRVSVSSAGLEGNGASYAPAISADGRFVAFTSWASNLVTTDLDTSWDVFVHDRLTGQTKLVSTPTVGGVNDTRGAPAISGDGSRVAFITNESLAANDVGLSWDVYVVTLPAMTYTLVTLGVNGTAVGQLVESCAISADGRFVAFESLSGSIVPGDTNNRRDVFVRDLLNGTTERVSLTDTGGQANNDSYEPSISADGRRIAFWSFASNLVTGDTNGDVDTFVRDRLTGTTIRASRAADGQQIPPGPGGGHEGPALSGDGRFVAFNSRWAVPDVPPGFSYQQTYVRDLLLDTIAVVSTNSGGMTGDSGLSFQGRSSLSYDGRYVAFTNSSGNLAPGDSGNQDVFRRDSSCGGSATAYGNGCPGSNSLTPVLLVAGCPSPGQWLTLAVSKGKPGGSASLLLGTGTASLPTQNGCNLLVSPLLPFVIPLPLSTGGVFPGSVYVPALLPASAPATTIYLQAFLPDAGVPQGYSNTNGVMLTIG